MLAIKADRAFDGEQQIPGGVTVLTDGGRIVGVEPVTAPLPERCAVVEFPDATMLPGLIDTHVHLGGDGSDGALDRLPGYHDEELAAVIEQALRRHLAVGVTTVRDLGDRHWSGLDRRDRAAGGGIAAAIPTIVASGPPITSIRGHCWPMGGEAEGDGQLRAAVRERAQRRVDVVKIMASGGATTAGTNIMSCQFSLADLRVLVDEAHATGLPVTTHAHGLPAVEQAVQAGVDGIEHCTCLTPAGVHMPVALLKRLANHRLRALRRTALSAAAAVAAAMLAVPLAPQAVAAPNAILTAMPPCENEVDIFKEGGTIHAIAVQHCIGKRPNHLSVTLEAFSCIFSCGFFPVERGIGGVSLQCPSPPTNYRNTRIPTKLVRCP